jgi:DNA polymerase-3 subunit gamma/tau
MATQALYRKWRSQTFEDVVGQEHVTLTLRNALRDGHMSHAYLFTGPRGTGKTSTARILAKAINCLAEDPAARPCNQCRICVAINEGHQLDLIEVDAASNRGIDEIRDLRAKIGFRPNEARYKIYIVDEVHMLTKEAFNALLKTLEEPPPHAVLVLATTEPDRVPDTVRSRCQRFDFRRIPTQEIVDHLADVLLGEDRRAAPEALAAIARRATGSMRDAISLLDQLLSYGDQVLELARVEDVLGLVDVHAIGRLVDCMISGDGAAGLSLINRLAAEGVEPNQLVDQTLAYLRGVLFVRVTGAADLLDVPADVRTGMARQAEVVSRAVILNALREFVEARAGLRDQVPGVPHLPVEMAFLRAAQPVEAPLAGVETVSSAAARVSGVPPPAPVAAETAGGPATRVPTLKQAEPPRRVEARSEERTSSAPELPAVAPAADASLSEQARANWDRFLVLVGKRSGMKVQAALRSVRNIEASGQTLVLYFAHTFSRDLVNQEENRVQVDALWQELLGRKVQVRCALPGEQHGLAAAGPGETTGKPKDDDEELLQEARRMGAVVTQLR